MELVSLCVFRTTTVLWQQRKGAWVQTIICKGTFDLLPGTAALSSAQEFLNEHDNYWDDDPARSVYSPSDIAPFKARCDVLLVGHAFAPKGEAVKSLAARLTVGEMSKTVEIFGERSWTSGGLLREASRFTKMPLRYERASGGPMTWNPVGVRSDARPDGTGNIAVPNLQVPGVFLSEPGQFLEPVGFGPIAPTWPPRRHRLGHHASAWNDSLWRKEPIPPDMDTSFWNSAPRDQQLAVLRSNEQIVLEHLHPEHAVLKTTLPGLYPRAFVDTGTGKPAQELPMSCDTLWIDTDRALCTLTFRACLPLDSAAQPGRILVALEGPGKRLNWEDILQMLELGSAQGSRGADDAELVEPESEDDPALATAVHPGLAAAAAVGAQAPTTANVETLTAATKVASPQGMPKAAKSKRGTKMSMPTMVLSDEMMASLAPAAQPAPSPPAPPPPPPPPPPDAPQLGRKPMETLPDADVDDSNRETALPPEPNAAPAIPFVNTPNPAVNAPAPPVYAANSFAGNKNPIVNTANPMKHAAMRTKTAPPPPPDPEASRIRFGAPPPPAPSAGDGAAPAWLNRPKPQTAAPPPMPAAANPHAPQVASISLPTMGAPSGSTPVPPTPSALRAPKAPQSPPPPVAPAATAALVANAALGGALAASNAAASAQTVPEAPAQPSGPMVIPKTYGLGPQAREACHLLWYDSSPQVITQIRGVPDWKVILGDLDAELRKRKSQDPFDFDEEPPPAPPPEVQERRDVFAILTRAQTTDPDSLGMLLMEAVTDDGSFIPPLVLFSGELVFPFDEVETLKATVTAATPFAGNDNKKLKETIDTANDLLKTPWIHSSGGVAEGMTQKVRDAFSQSARMLPAGYLDMHTSRVLLEQRHYQKRSVFGEESIRCEFTPTLSSVAIPAYLPSDLSKKLPMFQRFRSKVIAEAHVQQDQFESHPSALKVVALGRLMTLGSRAGSSR